MVGGSTRARVADRTAIPESGGLEDWRVLASGASAWFDAPSHSAGAALVRRVAALADAAGHRPDIDLRATGVHVRTLAHDAAGLTERDVALARAVSAAAGTSGCRLTRRRCRRCSSRSTRWTSRR